MKKNFFWAVVFIMLPFMSFASNGQDGEGEIRFTIKDGAIDNVLRTNIETNLNALFEAFENSLLSEDFKLILPKKGLTSDAKVQIREMWDSSPFACVLDVVETNLIKTSNGNYEVRNIPVTMMSEEADELHRDQMLLVQFDAKGQVENLTIAMNAMTYRSILANASEVELAQRQTIVNFIENFRTAYNRRDLKYLTQVYSDNALIITGRKITPSKSYNAELQKASIGNRYEYVKQTKQEYIDKLARIFKTSKYLNVDFDKITVKQHPKKPTMYGVTLNQYWKNGNYHDEGVLFLVIDFFDEKNPLIQVRTWQSFDDVEENGVFSFEKIKI